LEEKIKKKQYVLYLANYLDEQIVNERNLPTNNVAGTNRIQRLSEALSLNYSIIVVSPGVSLRLKKNKSHFYLRSKWHHYNKVKIFFSQTVSVPYLSVFYSYVSYFFNLLILIKRTKAKKIIIYNFDPLFVFIVVFLKCFYWNIKITNNIEDISIPKISDFSNKSEDRGLQQYIFYVCMKIIAFLSHAYIIPTKRFINYLPIKKEILIITGCLSVKNKVIEKPKKKIEVLFSGKIEFEHGIDIFIAALKLIEDSNYHNKININISGGGDKAQWLHREILNFKKLKVQYHGFVSNTEYKNLLENSDVCVALQKDTGRHSQFKTPSKVYEYLGNSKIVIATNVGDLSEISEEIINICKPLNTFNLYEYLIKIINEKDDLLITKDKVYEFSKLEYDLRKVGEKLYCFLK
jgi:glycosyltransferase involved in cell wall biosynthesis